MLKTPDDIKRAEFDPALAGGLGIGGALVGAPVGALYGLLTSQEGSRWGSVGRGAAGGALVGGLMGTGAGFGAGLDDHGGRGAGRGAKVGLGAGLLGASFLNREPQAPVRNTAKTVYDENHWLTEAAKRGDSFTEYVMQPKILPHFQRFLKENPHYLEDDEPETKQAAVVISAFAFGQLVKDAADEETPKPKLAPDTEPDEPKEEKKKGPGLLQAKYLAGIRGNDAMRRSFQNLHDNVDPATTYGKFIRNTAGMNHKLLDLRERSISNQATNKGWRMVSDVLFDNDSLAGMIANTAAAAGGSKEKAEQTRQMYRDSGMDEHRDKPKLDTPANERETSWHRGVQGQFADKDFAIAMHRWARKNHPAGYWLNPLDNTGPLNEMGDRLQRRMIAGVAHPKTTLGRFTTGVVPGLAPFMGGSKAQDQIRGMAARNGLYDEPAPVSTINPEVLKAAALSLTNLPIKQPSIDRAHSTTFRVEKAINKAREEREQKEMSTPKSAAVEFGRLVKRGGAVSEYLSNFNPLNMYGGSLIGGATALATPTRTLDQQASHDANDSALRALGNVLVPGMGAHNMFKRMGSSIRSPEMKAIKARRKLDAIKREQEMLAAAAGETAPAPQAKAAGWKTEALGALNPLSLFGGNHIAALAAAATPTRTLNQQSLADDETWRNILVPGRGVYNQFKRLGAMQRSPEMIARQNAIKRKKLEQEAAALTTAAEPKPAAPSEEKQSAYNFGRLVKRATFDMSSPMVQGGLAGAGIGALGGGLAGLISPGEEEDENGNIRRKSRFGSALTGALGGAGLGGLAGAGMGYMAPGMTNQMTGAAKKMIGVPTTGLTDGEYQAGLPAADAPGDEIFGA